MLAGVSDADRHEVVQELQADNAASRLAGRQCQGTDDRQPGAIASARHRDPLLPGLCLKGVHGKKLRLLPVADVSL